ncbi:MAG: glucose-1-phosphate cytidylyltransferase [Chloroflexi bacterium]|nr:glucose-1-phosphate cytidylyltransferase [Chloroflexota bacterium]
MKVVILCGGKGARLREYTEVVPKVLVEVGGKPILWHIMKIYGAFDFNDFVLCLGHMGDKIKQYFLEYNSWRTTDFTLRLGAPLDQARYFSDGAEPWEITFVETGIETNTGGRLKRIERYVDGDDFFATYGDGLADIDLARLLAFHRGHGRIATVTAVNPRSNFGILQIDGDGRVTAFQEKPRLDAWVNGGFFVFDRRIFDYLTENSVLETEPLERLAAEGEVVAYRHEGFWACMDTYKDTVELNATWNAGGAPWGIWER